MVKALDFVGGTSGKGGNEVSGSNTPDDRKHTLRGEREGGRGDSPQKGKDDVNRTGRERTPRKNQSRMKLSQVSEEDGEEETEETGSEDEELWMRDYKDGD